VRGGRRRPYPPHLLPMYSNCFPRFFVSNAYADNVSRPWTSYVLTCKKVSITNDVNPGYVVSACFSHYLVEHPIYTDLTKDIQQYRMILGSELCYIFANWCPLIGKIFFAVEWRNFCRSLRGNVRKLSRWFSDDCRVLWKRIWSPWLRVFFFNILTSFQILLQVGFSLNCCFVSTF